MWILPMPDVQRHLEFIKWTGPSPPTAMLDFLNVLFRNLMPNKYRMVGTVLSKVRATEYTEIDVRLIGKLIRR